MSPLPMTGTLTASFTALITLQSASPEYICLRVLGWTAIAAAPELSISRANSTAFICSSSQPERIFTVTGQSASPTAALTIFAASSGVFISALPPPGFTTFGTGQPMFMSIISGLKPRSPRSLTALAINSGSSPKSCMA